jgi:hypothetical protein
VPRRWRPSWSGYVGGRLDPAPSCFPPERRAPIGPTSSRLIERRALMTEIHNRKTGRLLYTVHAGTIDLCGGPGERRSSARLPTADRPGGERQSAVASRASSGKTAPEGRNSVSEGEHSV